MEILEYKFAPVDSVMYIVTENEHALIIDPCISFEAENMMIKFGIKDVLIILTHEHYDHISGVNRFKELFETKVLCSKKCAENIQDSKKNFSDYIDILFENFGNYHVEPYVCNADIRFEGEKRFVWYSHSVFVKETPGHSEGSICIIYDDKYAFTGDYAIEGREVFTKLPGGSKRQYLNITKPYIDDIKNKYIICPGHK